ncbi:MAG TPA: hypothetical protein VGJ91_24570 [Polyangiaceae bacterium]|jgi:hypothetical protein
MNARSSAIAPRAQRALFGSWLTTALACLGVIVPKCPLCAAAYLCLFGLSASSAQAVVKLGLPLCLTLIACSVLATALFVARRGRRVATRCETKSGCCGSTR